MGNQCCSEIQTVERLEVGEMDDTRRRESLFGALAELVPPNESIAKRVTKMNKCSYECLSMRSNLTKEIEDYSTLNKESVARAIGPFFYHSTKLTYKGTFLKGLRNGFGLSIDSKGAFFMGQYKLDRRCGEGILITETGDYYIGEFQDDKPSGHGQYCWKEGASYTGEFKSSKMNGQGTILWPNGTTYKGQFQNGLMHGIGIHRTTGEIPWSNEEAWRAKSWYEGGMRGGLFHGRGIYKWPNGKIYIGSFEGGQPHGEGVKYKADKTKDKEGIWKDGKLIQSIKIQVDDYGRF